MQAVLLGSPETKRTIYLKKAADQEDLPLLFLDWENWRETRPEGPVYLKIDPPKWESSSLGELRKLTEAYRQELSEAEGIWKGQGAKFLNTPRAICSLLDKRGCKETLVKAGVPVTEILNQPEGSSIACGADLIEAMRELKVMGFMTGWFLSKKRGKEDDKGLSGKDSLIQGQARSMRTTPAPEIVCRAWH